MDCLGELTTIDNRLGRAGSPSVRGDSALCHLSFAVAPAPILARSAALLILLLQDGTVDLELTSSVVALDPGLAWGTLQAASLESHDQDEIWQLPLAVVASGCGWLLALADGAPKVESSFDCATSRKLRQLYLRCVQRACIAAMLTSVLGGADPKRSYVSGLLFGLPDGLRLRDASNSERSTEWGGALHGVLADTVSTPVAASSARMARPTSVAASVFVANQLLDLPEAGSVEHFHRARNLAESPLWESWDGCSLPQRFRLLEQGGTLGKWVAANAPRLSPWEFMARLHRHKSWE